MKLRIFSEVTQNKFREKIYRETGVFTKRLQELLFVYGVVEIEELRNLYTKIYREEPEREHFCVYCTGMPALRKNCIPAICRAERHMRL